MGSTGDNLEHISNALFSRFCTGDKEKDKALSKELAVFLEEHEFLPYLQEIQRRKGKKHPEAAKVQSYISFVVWKAIVDYKAETPRLNQDVKPTPNTIFGDMGFNYNDIYLLHLKYKKFNGHDIDEHVLFKDDFINYEDSVAMVKKSVKDLIQFYSKRMII